MGTLFKHTTDNQANTKLLLASLVKLSAQQAQRKVKQGDLLELLVKSANPQQQSQGWGDWFKGKINYVTDLKKDFDFYNKNKGTIDTIRPWLAKAQPMLDWVKNNPELAAGIGAGGLGLAGGGLLNALTGSNSSMTPLLMSLILGGGGALGAYGMRQGWFDKAQKGTTPATPAPAQPVGPSIVQTQRQPQNHFVFPQRQAMPQPRTQIAANTPTRQVQGIQPTVKNTTIASQYRPRTLQGSPMNNRFV